MERIKNLYILYFIIMNDLLNYNHYFDINIPLELIDLIYDYLDIYNEMCRIIFVNIIKSYKKYKNTKNYCINYFDNNKYFNINLNNIIIKAYSEQEAILIWMNYINTLDIDMYNSYKYYENEFFFMLYLYGDVIYDNNDCNYINKILKDFYLNKNFNNFDCKLYNNNNKYSVIEFFFKNGIPKIIFDSYHYNYYNNPILWFSKKKSKKIILSL